MVQLSNPTCLRNRASALLGRPFRRCRHPSFGRRAPRRAKPRKWRPGRGWMWIKAKNNLSTSTAFFVETKQLFQARFYYWLNPYLWVQRLLLLAVGDWSPCLMTCCQMSWRNWKRSNEQNKKSISATKGWLVNVHYAPCPWMIQTLPSPNITGPQLIQCVCVRSRAWGCACHIWLFVRVRVTCDNKQDRKGGKIWCYSLQQSFASEREASTDHGCALANSWFSTWVEANPRTYLSLWFEFFNRWQFFGFKFSVDMYIWKPQGVDKVNSNSTFHPICTLCARVCVWNVFVY